RPTGADDVDFARAQAGTDSGIWYQGGRHRFAGGTGGDPERADPQPHGAPADPQEGRSLAPRLADYGRPAPQSARLSAQEGLWPLRKPDRQARSAAVTDRLRGRGHGGAVSLKGAVGPSRAGEFPARMRGYLQSGLSRLRHGP